ncbi:universal stress protein [Halohasta salina]|uniref:universal stress protein n=1 Tax=Halohasta salina TaxID=2961621 RepID=UPI0020A4DD51|nr:universal stress protein [Halohasta salina]
MYHVLLPVDGDEDRLDKQLSTLRTLPGDDELTVTVLYVHEEVDTVPDEAGKSVIESINESIGDLQGLPVTIERAADELEADGIPVDIVETQGTPTDRIIEAADELDADAVLIAGRGRTPVGKAVFGSVTQGVILQGERPVIVAG